MEIIQEETHYQNSFTIGTASTGGAIKIYFEDIHSEETSKAIDKAIQLWKNIKAITKGGK